MIQQDVKQRILQKFAVPILSLAVVVCGISGFLYFRSNDANQHFERATEYVRQKNGPGAEAEWLAVIKSDPNNIAARELLAEYYMSHQDWAKGADAFRILARLAPEKQHILCKQAACLLRMDNQVDAVQVAEDELKRNPDCVTALGLVTTLMAQRPGIDAKQQLNYLRRFAKLQPNDVDVQRMYVEMLANEYLYPEMRQAIAQLLKLSPNDAQAFTLLGTADLARPDQPQGAQDAVINFQRSIQTTDANHQANGGAHFGLGRAYLALKQPDKAVHELEIAVGLLPGIARVIKELGNAYQAAGIQDKAKMARDRFLALEKMAGDERMLSVRCSTYPDNPDYPRRLGELYLKMNDPARAAYYLKRAAKLLPGDEQIKQMINKAEKAQTEQLASRATISR